MRRALTAERLREVLSYDPATGQFTWLVKTSRCVRLGVVAGYCDKRDSRVYVRIDGELCFAHRLAWLYVHGQWPCDAMVIDHINRDACDNRIANLRAVPQAVNMHNQGLSGRKSISGLLGVSAKRNRWKAEIKHAGRRYFLGSYPTPEEAQAAYVSAKARLHSGFVSMADAHEPAEPRKTHPPIGSQA